MPVGTPVLATPVVGATSTSVPTASFTPSAGDLLIAIAGARTAGAAEPTISDDLSTTWTPVHSSQNGNVRLRVWQQVAAGSGRTVTVSSTGATQVGLIIVAIPGGAIEDTNVFTATSTTGDPVISMNAYGGSSIAFAAHVGNAGGSQGTPSGFTSLYGNAAATNLRMSAVYDSSSPSTTITYSTASTDSIGIGIEIKEGTLDKTITGSLFTDDDTFFASTLTPSNTITSTLYTDADTFFGATITHIKNITGALFTDADTFFGATITSTYTISGARYDDADTFFAANVVGPPQTITGALFTDADTFFDNTIRADSLVTGALYTDTDTFFASTISSVYPITGALYSDPDEFFSGTVTRVENQTITFSERYNDPDTFGGANVTHAFDQTINVHLYVDDDHWFNNEVQMTLPEVPQDPAEEIPSEFDPSIPPVGPQPPMFFTTMIDLPDTGRRRR